MYMFQPVIYETQLISENLTDSFDYKQLQATVYTQMQPTLKRDSCYATVFFIALFGTLRLTIEFLFPNYYNSLGSVSCVVHFCFHYNHFTSCWNVGENKKGEVGPYVASLFHHCFVVFKGFRCIILDLLVILSHGNLTAFKSWINLNTCRFLSRLLFVIAFS